MISENISLPPYSESLIVHFCRAGQLRTEAMQLPSLDLNRRQLYDLEALLNRAFYPLAGFLNRDDYEQVLKSMRLSDGSTWPLPVCLDVTEAFAASLDVHQSDLPSKDSQLTTDDLPSR